MPRIHAARTLDDVAEVAGVSSRCFNSAEKDVEKAGAKVMQVVRQLRYTSNFEARVMAPRRKNGGGHCCATPPKLVWVCLLRK